MGPGGPSSPPEGPEARRGAKPALRSRWVGRPQGSLWALLWGAVGWGPQRLGGSSSQGFQLQLHSGQMPPNCPLLRWPRSSGARWTSGDPHTADRQGQLPNETQDKAGPCARPRKGHWVPGTPQRSLRGRGPDSQALPQTPSAHHALQELAPRACALHPQEGGACSWDGAPPQACGGGAGPQHSLWLVGLGGKCSNTCFPSGI